MELRPSSTLTIPQDLILPKTEAFKNFLYLYLGKYQSRTSKTVPFFARLWMAPLFPNVVADSDFGTSIRGVRAANEMLRKRTPAGLLTLRKVNDPSDPHFYASIPVFAFNAKAPETLHNLVDLFAGKVPAANDAHNAQGVMGNDLTGEDGLTQRIIPVDKVLDANPTLTSDQRINIRNCLIQERIVNRGGQTVIFLDFRISKGEAQQLAVTPWLELRPIDLYPLVLQWVQTGFGSRAAVKGQKRIKPSAAAFSLSKIAQTLPKDQSSVARTNQFNLCIDFRGNEAFIPANLNNVQMYEDKFTQAGSRDGSSDFSLLSLDDETASLMEQGKDVLTKLPKNTPVLVDWLNSRYAYTQVDGMLRVQDISRFRAMDDSHAVTIMSRRLFSSESLVPMMSIAEAVGYQKSLVLGTPKELGSFENLLDANGDPVNVADIEHLKRSMGNVATYFDTAMKYYLAWEEQTEVRWIDIQPNGWGPFRPIYNWIAGLADAAVQNTQVLYTRYSVGWSIRHIAEVVMIAEYCKDVAALKTRDAAARSAAMNQSVDPKWEMEAMPMADGLAGFLPHQKKVRNLLKDSPDFAILPVQAGGGKSPLIVTDVLLEIKNNRSAPYLILCPPHLVPQYVSEINHFTKGKLNVVPVTSRAIMVNGLERLEKIIANSPRNTVVVASYDVLRYKPKGRMSTVCYGTTTIETYPVVAFLKQFGFKYVACDESHFLKNDSARSRAANALIVDIPKKRMASGTMAHDSPSDLAIQIGMLDPTLLGSREVFNMRYGEEFRGDRVTKWKGGASNAAKLIFNDIKKRVVVAGAMRKEWAAVLPTVIAKYVPVDLTPKQKEVYNTILEGIVDKLREEAKTNPTLAKFFEGKGKVGTPQTYDEAEDEEDGDGAGNSPEDQKKEDDLDEDEGAGLEALLQVHLARLEQFVTAPAKDILGNQVLQGDDRISPKVLKIAERLRRYIFTGWTEERRNPKTGVDESVRFEKLNGKVLIFCNYVESAEAIFEQMPDDLKKCGILYRASEKVETGAAFENDDRLKWMVGVSSSMDTGLNLQFCQALIRCETVWNPGTLEQGNARLNRPEFKKNLDRDKIFFDTIVANKTIDITKASRLISKVITVGKFDNQDSHHYDNVPDVEVISMSLESITLMNDWHGDLKPYMEAYRDFNGAQDDDYKEYRIRQGWPEVMTTEARAKLIQNFERAPDPKDAMRLGTNLYIPGSTIPHADKLGLIRLDLFLQSEQTDAQMEDDQEDDDESAIEEVNKAKEEAYKALVSVPCYTDNGTGSIMLVSTGKVPRVVVGFPDGSVGNKFRTSCVWVPKDTKLKALPNIDALMATEVGLPRAAEVEEATPIHVRFTSRGLKRAAEQQQGEKVKKQKAVEKKVSDQLSVVIHFVSTNGFLGLRYVMTGEDDRAAKALQAIGFRPSPEHVVARLKSGAMLKNLIEAWDAKGFVPDEAPQKGRPGGASATFFDMFRMLQQKLHRDHLSVYQMTKAADVANFYRQEFKPSSKTNVIRPYPLFQDRKAFIALPMTGQAGSRAAMRVRVPGIIWEHPAPELTFFSSKVKVIEKIGEIIDLGIQVINVEELRRERESILNMKVRKVEKED